MKKLLKFCTSLLCIALPLVTVAACGKDDSSSSSSSVKAVQVESISVKTNPTKVTYKINEAFSAEGLVISAHKSDGTDADLTAAEYTIDSTGFDNAIAGTYIINVILNEDNSKICDFSVVVEPAVLTGISAKEGYDNVFILYENVKIGDMNLTIVETYDDGSTVEVSGAELVAKYNCSIDTYSKGLNKKAKVKSNNSSVTFNCDITYSVARNTDLTPSELTIIKGPEITELALENNWQVSNYCLDMRFVVKYSEIPNREYNLGFNDVYFDYHEVTEATEPGKYNVNISYDSKSVSVEFTLLDISNYVLDSVKADATNVMPLYFLGEEVYQHYFIDNVQFYGTYKKDGAEDLVVPYAPMGEITVDIDGLTDTVGTKTITLLEDGNELDSYEIEVVEFEIPEGTYLYGSDEDGYYMYAFKNENSTLSFCSYDGEWDDSYEFNGFSRNIYSDVPTIIVRYANDDDYKSIELDTNGELYGYKELESTDVEVTFHVGDMTAYAIFANGKVGGEFVSELASYGEAHIGSKTGQVIEDLSTYTFTDGCEVYIVYQQDATGQPFLGNYINSQAGIYVVVKADGVELYMDGKASYTAGDEPDQKMEYRFEVDGNMVAVTLQGEGEGTIDLSKGELVIEGLTFTLDE